MIQIVGEPAAGIDDLAEVLGVDPEADAKNLTRAWATACSELDFQLANQFRPIEAHVLDGLRLEVAQEIFTRLDRVSSGSQFVDPNGGVPVRGPRDPLNRSYPILDRYRTML